MAKLSMILVVYVFCLGSSSAFGDWSANIGYQNPANGTWGLNFLYQGSKWGFETGIGWIDLDAQVADDDDDDDSEEEDSEEEKSSASVAVAGDIDMKYFISKGTVTPFLQAGFGVGAGGRVGSGSGAGLGAGGPFFGIGLLAGSKNLYLYGSFNANTNQNTFIQAGVGTDI